MSSSLPQSTKQAGVSSSYSAAGSFGPVFVVLAVIAVLAVLACVAGRLCARLVSSEPKPGAGAGGQRKHHQGHHHPRAVKDDDIEAAAIEFRINPAALNPAAVNGGKREPQTAADRDGWAKGAGGKNAGASGNISGSSVEGKPMTSA